MILEPKSKPVKFRIRSGGEEHSSLDSLRKNFVWADIKALCGSGKQLEKWLERIDTDVAKRYKEIENPAENLLAVYNNLFWNGKIQSNEDVLQKCESLIVTHHLNDVSKESELRNLMVLCREIISDLTLKNLHRYAVKYNVLRELFEPEIIIRVQRDRKEMDSEDLFAFGKFVFDSGQNKELAEEWIRIASSEGLINATNFIKENFNEARESIRERLFNLIAQDKVRRKLEESWDENEEIRNWIGFDNEEKRILSLSDTCMRIVNRSCGGEYSTECIKDMYQIAESQFKYVSPDDVLYEEKMFLMSLFDYDDNRTMKRLESIDNYPPAKLLLQNRRYNRDISFVAGNRKFKIGNQYGNSNNLDFWILNLGRFSREYEFQKLVSSEYGMDGHETQDDFDYLFSDSSVIRQISLSWKNNMYISPTNSLKLKNQLFKFSDKCMEVFNLIKGPNTIGDVKLGEEIERIMGEKLRDTDPLYMEKVFVKGLFAKNFDLARQKMKKIENFYSPAYRLANDATHTLTIENHRYSICDGWRRKNADALEYFIMNLPKFRKNVRFY